jgi:hypothetical protein
MRIKSAPVYRATHTHRGAEGSSMKNDCEGRASRLTLERNRFESFVGNSNIYSNL